MLHVLVFTIQITLRSCLHFLHPSVFIYKIMEENSCPTRLLGELKTFGKHLTNHWFTVNVYV